MENVEFCGMSRYLLMLSQSACAELLATVADQR